MGHAHQVVGGLAARREHGDDALAVLAGGDDPLRGALDVLRSGNGGAAELHHHYLAGRWHEATEDKADRL